MKVENMTSSKGNKIANQFILTVDGFSDKAGKYFQSYESIIAYKPALGLSVKIQLDANYWDYSTTTGKYRNIFLGETKAKTQAKIDSGEYILTDLN